MSGRRNFLMSTKRFLRVVALSLRAPPPPYQQTRRQARYCFLHIGSEFIIIPLTSSPSSPSSPSYPFVVYIIHHYLHPLQTQNISGARCVSALTNGCRYQQHSILPSSASRIQVFLKGPRSLSGLFKAVHVLTSTCHRPVTTSSCSAI